MCKMSADIFCRSTPLLFEIFINKPYLQFIQLFVLGLLGNRGGKVRIANDAFIGKENICAAAENGRLPQ